MMFYSSHIANCQERILVTNETTSCLTNGYKCNYTLQLKRHIVGLRGILLQQPIDILEVERRVLRACRTIRALPDRDRRFFHSFNSWPEVVQEVTEAYGYTETTMPRFRPTPGDVSDCMTALAWARGIPRNEWKLVWWRSFGVSFKHIGLRLGRSDDTARRRYKDAILGLWCCANKTAAPYHVRRVPTRQGAANMANESNSRIWWAKTA